MYDLIEELYSLVGSCFDQWHVLDPLRELVDEHEHEFEVAGSRFEWPDHVKTPTGERPG